MTLDPVLIAHDGSSAWNARGAKNRMRAPSGPALDLPPPFQLVPLRESGDAFAHAMTIAPKKGAGTLVRVGRFDLVEFAVVLEPAERLRTARRAVYIGLCALGDALVAHAPPEKPIRFDWPDAIRVDGGLVGGVRLGWPAGADEDAVPAWLVFGGTIRAVAMGVTGPLATALEEEGFDGVEPARIVESFTRHLMSAFHSYQEQGFESLGRRYLARLAPAEGARREIDENGDLLVRCDGKREPARRSLAGALVLPSWVDLATGGLRT